MPTEPTVVIQHTGLGIVSIGRERHAPAGAATVSLLGCLITVDPCTPEQPPHCLVSDADTAREVLEILYGPDVAQRVATVDDRPGRDEQVRYAPGAEMRTVMRLAETRWLRSNSPLPLDQRLLELEEFVLLGRIGELLDPLDEQWLDTLADYGEDLLRMADLDMLQPDGLADVVGDGLELLANHLPVSSQLRIAVAQRIATWQPSRRSAHIASTLDTGRLSRGLAPVGALHAGAESSLFVGSATVDWGDVPLGATSRSENNVQWTLVIVDDRAVVSVGVEGPEPVKSHPALAPLPQHAEPLSFDVLLPQWPLPVSTGQLSSNGKDDSWTGRIQLSPSARAEVEAALNRRDTIGVRVHAGAIWPPAPPLEAQAQRFAARGVSLLRLNAVQPETSFRESAAASLRRAESLWRAQGFDEAAQVCGTLAGQAAPRPPRQVWGQPAAEEETQPLPQFPTSVSEHWFVEATG